jgi:2-(1,2-epoxy-1,2-dihydrophenyl)acetyl-CoA isomerase
MPPQNNYFDVTLIEGIAEVLWQLATYGDCGAIVLCSQGRRFCAGADFRSGDGGFGSGRPGSHLYDHALALIEQPLPIWQPVRVEPSAAVSGLLSLPTFGSGRQSRDFRRTSLDWAFTTDSA